MVVGRVVVVVVVVDADAKDVTGAVVVVVK